jgi:hypothetical protein
VYNDDPLTIKVKTAKNKQRKRYDRKDYEKRIRPLVAKKDKVDYSYIKRYEDIPEELLE